MKHFDLFIKSTFLLCAVANGSEASAQLNMALANTAYTVDFDGTVAGVSNGAWAGTGFQPAPAAGRLDSDAWQVTGWSNGNLAFGGTRITAGTDYTRGASVGGIAVAGMWSFSGGAITGNALGFQPGVSDFEPGTVVLRVQNNTGSTLTAFDVAYNVFWNNDQAGSSNFNFSYSSDNVTYTAVPALNLTSPTTADGFGFTINPRSTTLSGLSIANGSYVYLRWRSNLVSGTTRDEFALDDISVTGRAYTMVRLTGSTSTVNEDGVSTVLTLTITNPDAINATNVDVALTSGSAARINGYTTQTKTFPAGSSANQTVTITITDNGACDGDETLVFTLQNITGGNNPSIGNPGVHTMSLIDNEVVAAQWKQDFDSGISDNWPITLGGGNISSTTGAGDTPANQRILTSPNSWQVINSSTTLELGSVDVTGWSNTTVTIRLSSTGGSATAGADGSDQVRVYVNLNGGGFPGTPDITISGNSNARWGYSTGTGLASTTAGTPASFQPAGGGNRTFDGYSTITITIPGGSTSVGLRIIANNNLADERWNIDNVKVAGNLCAPVYYSRGDGSETSVTWSTTRTGTATAVTFDKNASMVIQLGDSITTTNNPTFDLRSLTVESGGTLIIQGVGDHEIHGPVFDIDGSFSSSDDNFTFKCPSLQTISGSAGTITVNDLTLDSLGGILVTVNTLKIMGTLQIDQGDFNANNKEVQLISNASGTARLGPVASGASYTDRLRVERYIPAGVTDWRLICSPVQNKTISDWTDDFETSGFTGSTYPGSSFNSILTYNESDPGLTDDDGLTGATNVTNPLTPGVGFAAWSGATLGGTPAFVIDVRQLPTIAQTPFNIPMSYTNSPASAAVDGLNLVGNPLPSPIDFGALSLGADVDSFYYIYNPGSGTNASWDESLQVGTGGANGNIQSSQGFWLHCTGVNNTVTVDESAKVLEPINGGIFSLVQETRPMVRLGISSTMNDYNDESLVHFIGGDPAYGAHDVAKLEFANPLAPNLATLAGTERVSINAMGTLGPAIDVPVEVDVPLTGDYTITFSDVTALLSSTCITLEDVVAGTFTDVQEGGQYTFAIDESDPASPARFILHIADAITVDRQPVSCPGGNDGWVSALGAGPGPWDYTWTNDMGTVISVETGLGGASVLTGLSTGTYVVTIDGSAGCGSITQAVEVTQPPALAATTSTVDASCAMAGNGSILLNVEGGTAPYTYQWSDGSSAADLENVIAGGYDVTISDANGCELTLVDQVVSATAGPHAEFLPSSTMPNVGEPVEFFNFSTYGLDYAWDFGDGTTDGGTEPTHVYTTPGIYTVSMQALDGVCEDVFTMDIQVMGSTTVTEAGRTAAFSAWSDEGGFVIAWSDRTGEAVNADVLDAQGRVVLSGKAMAASGRMRIDALELATGTYVLRARQGGTEHSFKLPVIR